MQLFEPPLGPALVVASLMLAACLLSWALTGLVVRWFNADQHRSHPNERTMHIMPTPNVGGIAIVATVLGLGALLVTPTPAIVWQAACFGCLAVVSLTDQYRPLWPLTRLLAQALAVAAALAIVPPELRIAPVLPFALERVLIGMAWLWMINLTNFIDGIDGIAASGGASIALGYLAVMVWPSGSFSASAEPTVVAVLLAGACIGYLIWNWHPARVFMGDSGSIPLGFLIGWLMLDLAMQGLWVSALILPSVFVADATLTLLKRLLRGEKVWRAHRIHFYQRAVQGGAAPPVVVRRMLFANVLLIALAVLAKTDPIPAMFGAAAVVVLLLVHWSALAQGRPTGNTSSTN